MKNTIFRWMSVASFTMITTFAIAALAEPATPTLLERARKLENAVLRVERPGKESLQFKILNIRLADRQYLRPSDSPMIVFFNLQNSQYSTLQQGLLSLKLNTKGNDFTESLIFNFNLDEEDTANLEIAFVPHIELSPYSYVYRRDSREDDDHDGRDVLVPGATVSLLGH
jgi:hypothetical protein